MTIETITDNDQIEVKQVLLEVFQYVDEKDGKVKIGWEFPGPVNSFFMIGILEDVKHDLIHEIDETSWEDAMQ